jgi:hypothetical protein
MLRRPSLRRERFTGGRGWRSSCRSGWSSVTDIRSGPDRGGHFAAFEQPDRFVAAVRAALLSTCGSGTTNARRGC